MITDYQKFIHASRYARWDYDLERRETIEESWLKGDLDVGILPSGEVAGLISEIPSVKDVIKEMVSA